MTHTGSEKLPNTPKQSRFHVFAALRYGQYRLFWLAGAFSNVGMWALIFGRLWLMHKLTDSPFMLGVVTIASLGPVILFSMWGGVIADRVNRLRLVTITRCMFALLAFLTAILIATEIILPWHLILISLATGLLLALDIPSRQAMLPNLVPKEHLVNAVAVYAFVTSGSHIIGPAMFAPLVSLWGLEGLFFLIAIAYALTVVTLLLMRPLPKIVTSNSGNLWHGLKEGLSYVRDHRMIRSVLLIGIVGGLFGMSFETLLPIFADQVLTGDVYVYGWLLLAAGIGGVSGTIILAFIGTTKNARPIQFIAGLGLGLGLAIFSQIGWLPLALVTIAVVGASGVTFMTINNTIVQNLVDEGYRGRVMSLHQLTWGSTSIGGFLLGSLAQIINAPFALLIGGLIAAIGTASISLHASRSRYSE